MAVMTRDELERLIGGMDPQAGLDWYRSQIGQLPSSTGIVGGGSPAYEWQRMNEASGSMEYGPQIGTQGQLPGAPEGMQYWGTFDNSGNLSNVGYQDAPQRSWYQGIGPALPFLGALGAYGASQLVGAGGAGGLSGAESIGSLIGNAAGDTLAADAALGTGTFVGDSVLSSTIPTLTEAGTAALGAEALSPAALAGVATSGVAPSLVNAAANAVTNAGTTPGFNLPLSPQTIGTIAGGVAGGLSSATAPDSETVERRPYIDPRVDSALMGDNGYLNTLMGMAQQPLSAGAQAAGGAASDFLTNNYANNLGTLQGAASGQIGSNIAAPTMQAASAGPAAQSAGVTLPGFTSAQAAQLGSIPQAQATMLGGIPSVDAAQINFGALPMAVGGSSSGGAAATGAVPRAQQMAAARLADPSQQGTNLQPGFQDFIYGDQAQNQYLRDALASGSQEARMGFQNMLSDQNTAFLEQIMPSIRSGAIQAGGIGGSRQGIAEGIAARELAKNQTRAAQQFGQNLTTQNLGALSENFQQGRQLGAGLLGTLSGQQYGQEQQRAGLLQGANQTNAQLGTQANIAGAGNQTQASVASANNATSAGINAANNATQASIANQNAMAGLLGQQANLQQNASLANAGYQMQGGLANQNAANTVGLANTGFQMQGALANQNATNTVGMQNASGQNAYNLAGGQLTQNNQQFNTGQQNAMGQFNAGLQQQAGANNLSSQLGTNTLNQNVIQNGIANLGSLNTGAYNMANNAQFLPYANFIQGMQAYSPYAQMYSSGSNTTTPLYNNPYASVIGGALTGAQIGSLLR